jgi:prepilin-type N-terminal cleavage/methylation domain-containing protein
MKKGFTLAEVLITIGVIGVIAMLTMPVLTDNYKKRVLTTQLQKAHAELSQAGTTALATEMSDDFRKLKVLKNGTFVEKFVKGTGSVSFANSYVRYDCPDCGTITTSQLFRGYNYYCKKLSMGASFCVNKNGDGFLDVNSTKLPNMLGRDMFMIGFGKDGTIGDYDHYLRSVIRANWDLDASHR